MVVVGIIITLLRFVAIIVATTVPVILILAILIVLAAVIRMIVVFITIIFIAIILIAVISRPSLPSLLCFASLKPCDVLLKQCLRPVVVLLHRKFGKSRPTAMDDVPRSVDEISPLKSPRVDIMVQKKGLSPWSK